jgi:hypothetical protein
MHADDFIDWLQTVERVFDLREIPDAIKVKLVSIKLKKYASLWWEHLKKQRCREGKRPVTTWDKMKRLMRKQFLPINHKQDSYLEFHNLKHTTTSVEEFISEFDRMRLHCGIEEEVEEQTIAWFLGCLRPDITEVVYLQQYYSFTNVCSLAKRVEKQLTSKLKPPFKVGSSTHQPPPSTVKTVPPKANQYPSNVFVPPSTTSSLRCLSAKALGI